VVQLGVRDIPAFGTNEEVLSSHGLDANGMFEAVRRMVGT
jgi:hypothetical protein